MGGFDPFATWQAYQLRQHTAEQTAARGRRVLRESINPGQLHDPKDFVQKLRELSAEISSNAAMLEQFVEAHKKDPEWADLQADYLTDALGKLAEVGEELAGWVAPVEQALNAKEQREAMAPAPSPGGSSSGGKLFSKK